MMDFIKRGRAYYNAHPKDKLALIISLIALVVAFAK